MLISIHAPRTGSDTDVLASFWGLLFQSTLPAWGATTHLNTRGRISQFQSTLPARGATAKAVETKRKNAISIHAPRTGSDGFQRVYNIVNLAFQSTLPARGATHSLTSTGSKATFQSTLPARGATDFFYLFRVVRNNFNPRSPHGERRAAAQSVGADWHFNPRSPHGERPFVPHIFSRGVKYFNPRSPHGERQSEAPLCHKCNHISIHAPRTGSDDFIAFKLRRWIYFNPRSPHGERRLRCSPLARKSLFQSTLPARGATRLRW